jgi:hypothetical protein
MTSLLISLLSTVPKFKKIKKISEFKELVCWELGCTEVPFFCWLARGSGADWRHWAPEVAASFPSL